MTQSRPPSDSGEQNSSTPGKPKESGSRQQNHPGQSTHTGSPEADREHTERGGAGRGPKSPGAK
jgi:hypothetical protein